MASACVFSLAAELRTKGPGKKHMSLVEALKDDERLQHMSEAQILEEFRTKVCGIPWVKLQ